MEKAQPQHENVGIFELKDRPTGGGAKDARQPWTASESRHREMQWR